MDIDLPSCSQDSELPELEETITNGKTKKLQTGPTICAICEGKATGYHYDVASCNGCKSFFRRIVTEKLRYSCKYQDKCFENLEPGEPMPKCRSCRFKKCVNVGMNPLRIESELKQTIERAAKYDIPMMIEKPRQTIEAKVGELIDQLIRLDLQSEKFRDCAYNPEKYPTLRQCIRQETSLLSIADKYEPMRGWPMQKELCDEEFKFRKSGKLHDPLFKRWLNYELLTQIEVSKAMPFFSDLSESDKFSLVQNTVLMTLNLTRAFYSFEQKSDRLMRPDGVQYRNSPAHFKREIQDRLQNEVNMSCLGTILRVGLDRVEFVLLRALIMSNPAILELSRNAQNFLLKERQKYNIALFRYVMAKHGASGPARFASILGFIDVLEHQQRNFRDVHLLIYLARPRPFVIPIIDEVMKY